MKTLIVYYSMNGSTSKVADLLKSTIISGSAELLEIKLADKKRRGFFWAGAQVFGNKRPAIEPVSVNVNKYDLIILGTPVWAGSPSPVLLTFIEQAKITGRKIALYCCHGGGQGKALGKLKKFLSGNTIVGETGFANVNKEKPEALRQKVTDWASSLNA